MIFELPYIAIFALFLMVTFLAVYIVVSASKSRSTRPEELMQTYQKLINSLDQPCYILHKQYAVIANTKFKEEIPLPSSIEGMDVWHHWGNNILRDISYETFRAALKNNEFQELKSGYRGIDGNKRHILMKASPLDSKKDLALVQIIDETNLVKATYEVVESKMLLDRAQSIAEIGYWDATPGSTTSDWSAGMNEIYGLDTPALIKKYETTSRWSLIHEDDVEECRAIFASALERGQEPEDWVYRIIRPNGELRYLRNKVGIVRDAHNNVLRIIGVNQDITDMVSREDQLRHVQKMEAVGELTGGLSHDFNNLLQVILGNIELLPKPIKEEDINSLNAIRSAAERGAELTQRLLAFSRKQSLSPQSININKCVNNMLPILKRTLGHAITVEADMDEGLPMCKVDVGQLESSLLNLAINARHAMPDGGHLQITTTNVELNESDNETQDVLTPGSYVKIVVEDSGIGMQPNVLDKAFEPFFTTREVGEGSGLGLSMVYGFIKQSEGHISISSREYEGCKVTLYLRASESSNVIPPKKVINQQNSLQGKILLVEDDKEVSMLTQKFLESAGLEVVACDTSEEVIDKLKVHKDITLLLCDLLLSGNDNGIEVSKLVLKQYPEIKVLFMSGHSTKVLASQGINKNEIEHLAKPFRRREIIKRLETLMEEPLAESQAEEV